MAGGGDTYLLATDPCDTVGDRFYWCFLACGMGGKTVTFRFENEIRVGPFGAAVREAKYCTR